MGDQIFQTVASKLRKVISSDRQILEEICQELKHIADNCQSWRQGGREFTTLLSKYEDQIAQIEYKLIHTCTETGDVKNMRWFYHQVHKDVGFYCIKNTTNSMHDPYAGAVIGSMYYDHHWRSYMEEYGRRNDLMTLFEQNCRKKEELENMLNQVHRKLIKYKARQSRARTEESLQYIQEDRFNIALAAAGSQENEQISFQHDERPGHLQPSISSRRRPLAPLDLSNCRESNSADNHKADPLTRVRSPVLCAYLRKWKD